MLCWLTGGETGGAVIQIHTASISVKNTTQCYQGVRSEILFPFFTIKTYSLSLKMSDSLQSTGYLNKRIPLTHIFIESDQKKFNHLGGFCF